VKEEDLKQERKEKKKNKGRAINNNKSGFERKNKNKIS